MTLLIAGLFLFLGAHSLRIVADEWRTARLARMGERKWKGLVTLVSLVGIVLIVWGFGEARLSSVTLWDPPAWMPRVTSLLLLPAFVLIVAGNMRGTKMKAALGHPMLLGTLVWAFAHLLGNGRLAGSCCSAASWFGRSSTMRRHAAATLRPASPIRREPGRVTCLPS